MSFHPRDYEFLEGEGFVHWWKKEKYETRNKKREIKLKVYLEIFERILNNEKSDLRCEIFECEIGDILVLREWDNLIEEYTGRILEKEIIYILNTPQVQFYPQTYEEKHNFQTILF